MSSGLELTWWAHNIQVMREEVIDDAVFSLGVEWREGLLCYRGTVSLVYYIEEKLKFSIGHQT